MKGFLIILLTFLVATQGLIVPNSHFRTQTLNFFNDVREMMAVGSVSRITTLINAVSPTDVFAEIGPASNMYRLTWSRKLEQIAYENGHLFGKGKELPGYPMFQWTGDIFEQMKALVDIFPWGIVFRSEKVGNLVRKILGAALETLAVLIRVVIIALDYPKTLPIPPGTNLSSTNALFAERSHIGCFNRLLTATCVLEEAPGDRKGLFKKGVPCTECPEDSRCEITEREDGWYEEGDLCIPLQNDKPRPVKAARTSEDYDDEATTEGSGSYSLTTTLLIFAIIKILNVH